MLVVAPALNSRLRHLFADVDKAREAAEGRLHESLKHLDAAGIKARGAVGDTDPVRAMGDALFEFDADEIVISTHPPGRSNWMEKGVVDRARAESRRADHARRGRSRARRGVGLGQRVLGAAAALGRGQPAAAAP